MAPVTRRAVRTAAAGLRALRADLAPSAGAPVPPLRLPRWPWVAWLPQVLLGLAAVVLAGAGWHVLYTDFAVPNRLAAALGIAAALPVAVCLQVPMLGWWTSLGLTVVTAAVVRSDGGGPLWPDPTLYVYLVVLGLVGLRVRLRALVEIWLLTLLASGLVLRIAPGPVTSPDLVEVGILTGAVLVAAGSVRTTLDARHRLAVQTHVSEAERSHRALLEERTRIARELHDVVAHHMSVIAIQAEAAPYRVPDPPEELASSFRVIRANALNALTELRRVLGLLRPDGGADDAGPQPGLDRLDDLLANSRAAGLAVTAALSGPPRPLPPGVDLSAYRILQEALSNAMRHAPGAQVRVEVRYRDDGVALRVVNGPARAVPEGLPSADRRSEAGAPGHGLLGMRERATMLGGQLTSGPAPDGGYAVSAVLPGRGDERQ